MTNQVAGAFMPVLLIMLLAMAGNGCATGGIEKPRYTVEVEDGRFEVRVYAEQIVAETRVQGNLEQAGNAGFRPLFDYISGKNRAKTKIAMTAPVGQEKSKGEKIPMTAPVGQELASGSNEWAVTFMMPAEYTMATLPEPADENVRLRVVPAYRAAAVRYSGRWSWQGYEKHLAELEAWMKERELVAGGVPLWARYDPPITPWFLRRNEVIIPLAVEE